MGAPAVAGVVAHLAFWVMVPFGWTTGELRPRTAAGYLALSTAGVFGLPALPQGHRLVTSYVAILDIARVFAIFKGDVRLS